MGTFCLLLLGSVFIMCNHQVCLSQDILSSDFSAYDSCSKDMMWNSGIVLSQLSECRSKIGCALQCAADTSCESFNYHVVNQGCILYKDVPAHCSQLISSNYWHFNRRTSTSGDSITPCPKTNTCANNWTKIFEVDIHKNVTFGSHEHLLEVLQGGMSVRILTLQDSQTFMLTPVISHHILSSPPHSTDAIIFEIPEQLTVGSSNETRRCSYRVSSYGEATLTFSGDDDNVNKTKSNVAVTVFVQATDCVSQHRPIFSNVTNNEVLNDDAAWSEIHKVLSEGHELVVQINNTESFSTYTTSNSLLFEKTRKIAALGRWSGIKANRSLTNLGPMTVGETDIITVPGDIYQEYTMANGLGIFQSLRIFSETLDISESTSTINWYSNQCWTKVFQVDEHGAELTGYGVTDLLNSIKGKFLVHFGEDENLYGSNRPERTLNVRLVMCFDNSLTCSAYTEDIPSVLSGLSHFMSLIGDTEGYKLDHNNVVRYTVINDSIIDVWSFYQTEVSWYKDSRRWVEVFSLKCCNISSVTGNLKEAILAGADFIIHIGNQTSQEVWTVDMAFYDLQKRTSSLNTSPVLRHDNDDSGCPTEKGTRTILTLDVPQNHYPAVVVSSWNHAYTGKICKNREDYSSIRPNYELQVLACYG